MNGHTLAEKVREFRNRVGLTQEELALQAGVTGGYLAQIETGKRSPNRQTLITLCKALKLEKSEEDALLVLSEQDQRERLQDRAKTREKALLNVVAQTKNSTSRTLQEKMNDTTEEQSIIRPMMNEVEVILDGRIISAAQYYISRDLDQIERSLHELTIEVTQGPIPSVCLLGLGRCGTNIAVRVSTLAYEAKKAFLTAADKEESETEVSKKKSKETLKNMSDWLHKRYQDLKARNQGVKAPIYLVEPIVLIGDLDVDIEGRIKASGYKTILQASDSKLKILDFSEFHSGGAGNVPLVGQYLAKTVLNGEMSSFIKDPKWKNYHSYLIDSAGFKDNPTRLFFYIFSAGGGTGSGMSSEFALAQQYSYHHRIHSKPEGVKTYDPETKPKSSGFEPIFSAGIAILPHFNPRGGEFSQAIHVNAGRLICKYLSEEWRFSKTNLMQKAESGLEDILRPWNALMLISNNIMRDIEESEDGQKIDVTQMEERANQYVAQQIFNILTAQAQTKDYDEKYYMKAGISRKETEGIDPSDLYMSLTGPVAIAYAESMNPAKEGSALNIEDVFIRSISLPSLNKQTHAIEGISILPQPPERYAETLRLFRENGSALNDVKFFAKCSAIVSIISMPKGTKLPNVEFDNLKLMMDRVFPHTRIKRYPRVVGTSSHLSLTTLIARSACLSDEVLTLLFAYIKRCFAKEKYKYTDQIEGEIINYLIERNQDGTRIKEVLKELEDPSEIMEANWQEVKSMYERKYRTFLPDPKSFVAMDSVRLTVEDVIDALKYISATLRHQSVPLTPTDITSWEVRK